MADKENSLYLPDKPINTRDDDKFRHTEYAETLKRIIEDTNTPWHIGLFGPWGSGKTSVIKILKENLDSNTNTILVEFDAWKHAEESIRTELLLELDEQLGKEENADGSPLLGEEKITEELYDVTEGNTIKSTQGNKETDIQDIIEYLRDQKMLILLIISLSAISLAVSLFIDPAIGAYIGQLIIIPILLFMTKQLADVTSTLQRKFLYPRREWSGAYERIFEQMLDKVDSDKIVISIDNLDRCETKTSYDVLISLKTFLDKKRCVYIVPCDDEALRSQVKNIDEDGFLSEGDNDEEFLKKFFQSQIYMHSLLSDDIDSYVNSLNRQLKTQYDQNVMDVLTSAYIENPRHIKQAINRVTTLRLLADEVEKSEADHSLNQKQVTTNIPFLAKVSVLQSDFPDYYRLISSEPDLLDESNKFLRNELNGDLDERLKSHLKNDGPRETRLASFLGSTLSFTTDSPRIFFELCEPEYNSLISDYKAFSRSLRSGQVERAREIVQNDIERDNSQEPYLRIFDSTLDDYQRENRIQPFMSTTRVLVEIFDEFNSEIQDELASIFYNQVVRGKGKEVIQENDLYNLFSIFSHLDPVERNVLIGKMLFNIENISGYSASNVEAILENKDLMNDENITSLNDMLNSFSENDLKSALDLFHQYESGDLLNDSVLSRTAEFPKIEKSEGIFTDVTYYLQFDESSSIGVRDAYVDNLTREMSEYQGGKESEILKSYVDEIVEVTPNISEETARGVLEEVKDICEQNELQRADPYRSCFHIYPSMDDDSQMKLFEELSTEIPQWNKREIKKLIKEIDSQNVSVERYSDFTSNFLDQIPEKFDSRQDEFLTDYVVPLFGPDHTDKLAEKIEYLLRSKQNNKHHVLAGAKMYTSRPGLFSNHSIDIALAGRKATSTNSNHRNKEEYIKVETISFEYLKDTNREKYLSKLREPLSSNNKNKYENFATIWNDIEVEKEDSKRTVAREIANLVEEKMQNKQKPKQIESLIDIWISNAEYSSEQRAGEIVDVVSDGVQTNDYKRRQKELLLDFLASFNSFYGREDQILDRIHNFVDENQNRNSVTSKAKPVLDKLSDGDVDEEKLAITYKYCEK